ncbi:glycoside hydrolase family 76 protein [Fulvivirga ligni]|uniref:glycoside hydrolase family 76 protein n=1 Tax=Fulvivirga ligni TaxID=2904246 RepID=UPI001F44709F|nr:glycoside hydrolase family 76 protein [Fulvivirga ligni]UII19979.1 hypothetical protein LVD16_19225 [Fulvivirga ligni]
MKFYQIIKLIGLSLIFIISACSIDDYSPLRDPEAKTDIEYTWSATADSMQNATYTTYLSSNGTFKQDNQGNEFFNYWWNAHMVHVLIDGYNRTADNVYISRAKALVEGIYTRNGSHFPNEFNDDMAWLAIACTRAYEASDDNYFLDVSKLLWSEIIKSWSDLYDGGITWKTNTPLSKNAVSNAPVAILSMRLYQLDGGEDYFDWAKKIYDWQKNTLVDPATGLVWDNINTVDGDVVVNKDWIFTYNIGTYIGASLELYNETKDAAYLNEALKTATSMMTSSKLTTEGMLRDEGQGDGGLFKGILIRYFTTLILHPDINEANRKSFQDFFQFNAETFYEKGLKRPSMLSNSNWKTSPGDRVDFSTQLSGVMLVEAAALLHEEGLLE